MTYHAFQLLWLALIVALGVFLLRHRHEWVVLDLIHVRCGKCGKVCHMPQRVFKAIERLAKEEPCSSKSNT
jgi:hypothetical protein